MRSSLGAAIALLSVSSIACSGSVANDDASIDAAIVDAPLDAALIDASVDLSFDEFVRLHAEAECAYFARCQSPRVFDEFLHTETTDCDRQWAEYDAQTYYAQVADSIADGWIIYHPELARACIEATASAACGRLLFPSCDAVLQGTVPHGGRARVIPDCDEGTLLISGSETCFSCTDLFVSPTTCIHDVDCLWSLRWCMDGACVPRSDAGETCEVDGGCIDGLRCASGTCVDARQTAGDSCGNSGDCVDGLGCIAGTCAALSDGMCARDGDCASGEHCVIDTDPGTCAPSSAVGGACPCLPGVYCVRDASGERSCSASGGPNGAACTNDDQCWSRACVSGSCAHRNICP